MTERHVLQLARFNPTACDFPRARVPLLPVSPVFGANDSSHQVTIKQGTFRHFTRGRYALGEAYRLAGLGKDGALLAPAYHCVTMLDPALSLGAEIHLYPLNADLSPDLASLDVLLAHSGTTVKALLATHFFGFAQDFRNLKEWCDKHRIVLIEDCAHVLFTEKYQAAGTGTCGRFVTSSPYKFFPCEDGGLLLSPEKNLLDGGGTASAGWIDELRAIKHCIEKYRSISPMRSEIALIDPQLERLDSAPVVRGEEQVEAFSKPSPHFSMTEISTRSLLGSRIMVGLASTAAMIQARRSNYERWAQAVDGLPNGRALYPVLPTNCVPYMFPLYIDHPDPHFYWLKHLGVPIWRWDEMAVSCCPVAQDYRLHVLHLPCHQSLTEDQMDWMIAAVQKTLKYPAQGDR